MKLFLDIYQAGPDVLTGIFARSPNKYSRVQERNFFLALGFAASANVSAQMDAGMKSINSDAPVKCEYSIVINARSEKVWSVLTDIDHWSVWQTDIKRPKLKGQLRPNATFVWRTGGAKVRSTLHTVVPNKVFGWTGKTYGMYAVHNWTLTESNGKTTVFVSESMEGFLARVFKKSFTKNLESGMLHWLTLLKKECEK